MLHRLQAIAIATLLFNISTIALAQIDQNPSPDRNGNYNTIQRKDVNGKQMEGVYYEHRSWIVIATSLNCRSAPGTQNQIVRRFAKNQLIEAASFGRGGSDEVVVIQRDASGKPWMRVNLKPGQCFVRANHQYIEPNSLE
ncbi:hypothetical protein [Kamptonema sp. UHCC 0994]|uniref:hypothetical protein n=1 Tax=Kamptonema sp. UHCC 0994 TaxID=3031329 RepID=UPI0023BA0FAF|nr:hypothetical protein [Kamptonema sp. UHCC 0994]MDF0554699.1 hypothetical protein [Kamptonema sp. UHCC 0994]